MRRSIHIAIALLAVLALVRPFDCLAFTRKSAACCMKGKCMPSANADECCKGTAPGSSNQLSTTKATDHSTHLPALGSAIIAAALADPSVICSFDEAHAPPGSPPSSRLNLPLLI
jgi:hypothetical protein